MIEDAAYRELRYDGDDLPSLRSFDPQGKTVIHAGTFSKAFSPGIRVGWGILPPTLVPPVLAAKGNTDFGSPHLNQALMATVLRLGLFEPHVEELRASYRHKIDVTLAAAVEFLSRWAGLTGFGPTAGCTSGCGFPDISMPELAVGASTPRFARVCCIYPATTAIPRPTGCRRTVCD